MFTFGACLVLYFINPREMKSLVYFAQIQGSLICLMIAQRTEHWVNALFIGTFFSGFFSTTIFYIFMNMIVFV